MSNELTPKQEAFALKYVELGNASEAYRQSYDAENMLPKSVWEEASRTLANPDVAARVMELQELHQKRHAVTVDRVLKEYAKLAFVDIRKLFDESGNLIPIHEMDDDTAAAIAGIEVDKKFSKMADENGDPMVESRLHKIKLSDKKGALDSIARHLGMFTDKAEISGPNGGPIETKHSGSVTLDVDLQSKSLDELTRMFTEKMKG